MNCDGNSAGTVTHRNGNPKDQVVLTWTYPEFAAGPEKPSTFIYTVVQEYSTFWAKQQMEGTVMVKPKSQFHQGAVLLFLSLCGQ